MTLPSRYKGLTSLDAFLEVVLKAHPSVESAIDKIVDGSSDEYKGYHYFTVKDHVTVVHVRQFGVTWQVSRVSNLRNTTGYEQYTKAHWDTDELQVDERIVTYKCFIDEWLPWQTIPL